MASDHYFFHKSLIWSARKRLSKMLAFHSLHIGSITFLFNWRPVSSSSSCALSGCDPTRSCDAPCRCYVTKCFSKRMFYWPFTSGSHTEIKSSSLCWGSYGKYISKRLTEPNWCKLFPWRNFDILIWYLSAISYEFIYWILSECQQQLVNSVSGKYRAQNVADHSWHIWAFRKILQNQLKSLLFFTHFKLNMNKIHKNFLILLICIFLSKTNNKYIYLNNVTWQCSCHNTIMWCIFKWS